MDMDSKDSKPPVDGVSPPTAAEQDGSLTVWNLSSFLILKKAKEAPPFIPHSSRKTMKSEATPFTPVTPINVM